MSELHFVNANGEPIQLGTRESHKPVKKPKATGSQEFHKGFRVKGHPPGAMEEARKIADDAWRIWQDTLAEEQARKLASGYKTPEQWNEADWLRNTKKKPVRSKPYEVPEAADKCAEMAKKAGWLCVEVLEIKKGEARE